MIFRCLNIFRCFWILKNPSWNFMGVCWYPPLFLIYPIGGLFFNKFPPIFLYFSLSFSLSCLFSLSFFSILSCLISYLWCVFILFYFLYYFISILILRSSGVVNCVNIMWYRSKLQKIAFFLFSVFLDAFLDLSVSVSLS